VLVVSDSPTGWRRRWARAHSLAPVLAAAVAGFTERYVLHGRCPADDVLDGASRSFDRL
jgi:hypothetical protein